MEEEARPCSCCQLQYATNLPVGTEAVSRHSVDSVALTEDVQYCTVRDPIATSRAGVRKVLARRSSPFLGRRQSEVLAAEKGTTPHYCAVLARMHHIATHHHTTRRWILLRPHEYRSLSLFELTKSHHQGLSN